MCLIVVHGHDDDAQLRQQLAQWRDRIQPALAGQRKIEQHDVGPERHRLFQRLARVLCFGDRVDAGLPLQQADDAGAHQCVVVDNQYAHRFLRQLPFIWPKR